MRSRRSKLVAAAVFAIAVGALSTGVASAATSSSSSTPKLTSAVVPKATANPKAEAKLCAKLPQLIAKNSKAAATLPGDASVKGSVAWVQAKAAKAAAAGHPQLATLLNNRASVMASRENVTSSNGSALQQLQTACATQTTTASPTSTTVAS